MSINLYKKKTINNQPVLEELLSKSTDTVDNKPLVYDSAADNVKSVDDLCVNTVTANCFHGPLDGTAKNATCFNNKTYADACADILSGCAADSNKLNGKTYSEVCADILSGCAADSNRFNGKTYSEACTDILSGTAANATCFAGKTCTEWKDIIKTTCVDNAALATNSTCFNGCTYAQAKMDIRDGLATQTCVDAVQACANAVQACADAVQNCADFIQSCVSAIESKIPAQASASNQLADKAFVNSSITTNTANFRGTYSCVADLPSTGNTNNDYAFVCSLNTTTGNYIYDRYKWVASSSSWVCEYEINTTGFTAEQLASINSGITSNLVAKITDVYDNTVTVCMNGECKGSFNLNQNTDVCIDLGSSIRNATCFNGKTYSEVCSDILSGTANNARNLVGSNGCVKLAADCVTVCESNTYLGKRTNNVIGNDNTAVGCAALDTSCTTERNTAIGRNALVETCGNCNVAVGHNAGAFSELKESVSIGHMAGCSSSGRCNVAIGEWSLCKESGSNNTAIGSGTHTANRNKSGTVTIGSGVTAQCNYQAVIGYCDKCCLTFNMCNGTLTAACFDGNAASADNATCFNGCTYACAKEDIRNGMAAAISIGDSCPYQADGNRVVHIPAYPPDLSSCDGLDCTGTVTQVKVGTTAYDPVSGVVSLPEYPTIPTTVCTAECANTVKRNTANSGSCYLALFDGNTAVNDASLYVSNSKAVTYAPATGILSTCCVKGISNITAGNPIGCTSTTLGQSGTNISSGTLNLYTCTPTIGFHVNRSAVSSHCITATCGNLTIAVTNGTGCTAATTSNTFDFCSDGTFKGASTICASTNIYSNGCPVITTGTLPTVAPGYNCTGTSNYVVTTMVCCAKAVCRQGAYASGSWHLALFDNNTSCASASVYVSATCPLTYNPATGLLCSDCIQGNYLCIDEEAVANRLIVCTDVLLGSQCDICIYDACGNDFICAWCNNLTIGYNSSDFVNDSHECCRITIGLNNYMCAGTSCGNSVVVGYNNCVCWPGSSNLSLIYGYDNTTIDGGLAIGGWNTTCGECSIVLGFDSSAQECSISIGISADANCPMSIAIGCGSHVYGCNSIAIGYESRAECCCVIAIGRRACSFIDNGLSIGCEATTEVIKRSGTTEIFGCVLSDIHRGDYRDVAIHSSSNIMQCELYKAIADRIDLSKDLATQCICTIPDINCSLLVRGRYNNLGITSIQHQKYSGFCNLILTLSDNSMASISSVGSNVITAPVYLEVTGLSV